MQTSFTQSISPSWTTNFYSYKPTAMLMIFQLDIVESPRLQMISRLDLIPGLYFELFLDRDF